MRRLSLSAAVFASAHRASPMASERVAKACPRAGGTIRLLAEHIRRTHEPLGHLPLRHGSRVSAPVESCNARDRQSHLIYCRECWREEDPGRIDEDCEIGNGKEPEGGPVASGFASAKQRSHAGGVWSAAHFRGRSENGISREPNPVLQFCPRQDSVTGRPMVVKLRAAELSASLGRADATPSGSFGFAWSVTHVSSFPSGNVVIDARNAYDALNLGHTEGEGKMACPPLLPSLLDSFRTPFEVGSDAKNVD